MSKKNLGPAEAFPPGEFILEELEARGWSQVELARILGRPIQTVNMIVNGKKSITAETALELAAAFGTSAELWMNLETAYRLHQADRRRQRFERIKRRAKARRKAVAR